MKALLYLNVRTLLNGVRRALTSGRRLIGLIFVIGYYTLVFIRPFERPTKPQEIPPIPESMLPQTSHIEAFVFAAFAILSFFLSLSMFGPRAGFKQADVDVLFPTPVKPGTVLLFQIARTYLATLLLPLLFAIFGYRGASEGVQTFNAQYPQFAPTVFRTGLVAYLLLALFWVFFTNAVSLYLNRNEVDSDRLRKRFGWGYGIAFGLIMAYVVAMLNLNPSLDTFVNTVLALPIRIFFFPATLATMLVTGAATNNGLALAVGTVALLLGMYLSFRACMKQAGWMYDQAATATALTAGTIEAQKKGDFSGMLAEQARQGKLKGARGKWYHRIRVEGPAGLAWKEFIFQLRSTLVLNVLMSVFAMALPIMVVALPSRSGRTTMQLGYVYLGMSALGVFLFVLSTAAIGFFEVLRRVDLLKPLPFSAQKIVFWELVSKAIFVVIPVLLASLIAVILKPILWMTVLGGLIFMPTLALILYSATFLVTVLFPDIDDPTQRGFRGLMQMLGIVIVGLPGATMFAGMIFAGVNSGIPALNPVTGALLGGAANLVIVAILTGISGKLYASYNPSE